MTQKINNSKPSFWYKGLFVCLLLGFFITLFMRVNTNEQNTAQPINNIIPQVNTSEANPGGETSVSITPFPSFMRPAKNLLHTEKKFFHAGKALAHQPWVKAPTITDARDGLGPLYNARTCLFCHVNGGRGKMPEDNKTMLFSAFLRLSISGTDKIAGIVPEPTYGDQLQSQSIALSHQLRTHTSAQQLATKEAAPEAYVYINWQNKTFIYPDHESIRLRYPELLIKNLGYGAMHPETMISLRNAPPLIGMGLLELIAQKDLDQHADPDDQDHNGISGRLNQVWDFEAKKTVAGRFGLKANKASVRLQSAGAFANDMGISNPIFPRQSCTKLQQLCNQTPNGNGTAENVEIPESLLTLVVNFTKNLAVPQRRSPNHPKTLKGRTLFYQIGCQQCHTPRYVTQKSSDFPHLSEQTIWPYTDLLLHDMGKNLADGRPDYLATGNEWRTPPLWGVGLGKKVNGSDNLLHDGRAQNVEAAILWHGGEAEVIKQRFIHLQKTQRHALIQFVESL